MANNALNVSFDNGFGSIGNVWNVAAPKNGEVTLSGSSSMMEWATGPSAGHGYGTYTVTAKVQGNEPGPGIILWPGDNKWPGQEIDMLEITPDGSGRQYGTVHWNNNGKDAFATDIFEGVKGGAYHDYTMVWEPGKITFKVDGVEKGEITTHVPTDYAHGGMNNTIGVMNTNNDTSITVSHISFTPLGGSTPAPAPAPTPEPAPAPAPTTGSGGTSSGGHTSTGGATDWNAIAAAVTANFNATGKWELPSGGSSSTPAPAPTPSHSEPVDWNAIAAQVLANHDATGHWFM